MRNAIIPALETVPGPHPENLIRTLHLEQVLRVTRHDATPTVREMPAVREDSATVAPSRAAKGGV